MANLIEQRQGDGYCNTVHDGGDHNGCCRQQCDPELVTLKPEQLSHDWCAVPAAPDKLAAPGIIVYRFEANLFYANASFFVEEILRLVTTAKKPIHGVVLDVTGIDYVDYTAAKMLLQVRSELNKRGVTLVAAAVSADAIDYLRRYGLAGDKEVYPTIDAAIAALSARGNAVATA